jgi:hypothetical protein
MYIALKLRISLNFFLAHASSNFSNNSPSAWSNVFAFVVFPYCESSVPSEFDTIVARRKTAARVPSLEGSMTPSEGVEVQSHLVEHGYRSSRILATDSRGMGLALVKSAQ